MNPPSLEVVLFLQSEGLGVLGGDADWCLNYGAEPEAPDSAVTIYDTPSGAGPDTDQLDIFYPTFQVRVRSKDYAAAYEKHELIRDALTLEESLQMSSSKFVSVSMTSDIASIGRDDNNRHVLVANYRAIRTR